MSPSNKTGLGTALLHADHDDKDASVSPGITVTTTFKTPQGVDYAKLDMADPAHHIYARYTTPNSVRVEKVLSAIIGGHAITYRSGLAAAMAAIIYYKPRRVAIGRGYWGIFHMIEIYKGASKDLQIIDLDDEYREGDLAWVESPVNPTGESRDIRHYADKIHAVGGKLIVDSTFGPPPLQDPFALGADCVMHSATKYFGGHSDLLGGVLSVKSLKEWQELFSERVHHGNVMGSLEAWLLLRSLRTLHLRVPRQSASATELVKWLKKISDVPSGKAFDGVPGGIVTKVFHSSLQGRGKNGFDPEAQMPGGFSPTFAMLMRDADDARQLPFSLKIFTPATSLGGVESLIEHRAGIDPTEHPCLVRLSIGVEDVEDLKSDLRQALQKISSGASPKARL